MKPLPPIMSDTAPWLLTVALGCAGWFVTHTVDRVTSSPTLEYELTLEKVRTGAVAQLQVANLTRDRTFDDVRFDILAPNGVRFGRPSTVAVQPADDGTTPPDAIGGAATFTIARMQPGNVYRLTVPYAGKAMPTVRITSEKSVIRPVRPSLETNFARYEFRYFLGLGLLGAAASLAYLYFARRAGRAVAGPTTTRPPVGPASGGPETGV